MKTKFASERQKEEVAEQKQDMVEQMLRQEGFSATGRFSLKGAQVLIDSDSERWTLLPEDCEQPEVHHFSEVLDCRLWESTTKAGTTLRINIILDDISRPLLPVGVINYPVPKDSPVYKNRVNSAQEIVSAFLCISGRNRREADAARLRAGVPASIRELAGLERDGLITREEFESKKAELLSRM